MILLIVGIWFLLWLFAVLIMAYDPFSQTWDWELNTQYLSSYWMLATLYIVFLLGAPLFFLKSALDRINDYASGNVRDWRTKGSFTKDL